MNREDGEINETRIDDIGFGHLKLKQNPKDFCFGVDAVLLADFASKIYEDDLKAIDLGTNTGVIPLILSHKTNWHITGVELKKSACDMALDNIKLNNLENRIDFLNSDILELKLPKGTYDVVVSNPPYKEIGTGIKSKNIEKMVARHEVTASLEDFLRIGSELLKVRGHYFMVHRPSRLVDIFCYARKYKLEPKEIRLVSPKKEEQPNIVLIHMIKQAGKELNILPGLSVYDCDGNYTKELLKAYEKI